MMATCGRLWAIGIFLALIHVNYTGGERQKFRLAGSTVKHAGRVEIFHNGRWGTVCDNAWDLNVAHVICRELDFSGAILATCCAAFGKGIGQVNQLGVRCRGNETRLSECSREKTFDSLYCYGHEEDAGIVCKPKDTSAMDFKIRLRGSNKNNSGRVEVRYYGVWGTVSAFQFFINEAHVVCKQLGYLKALAVYTHYEGGSGPVWISSVNCIGNETSLENCTSNLGDSGLSTQHWNDVGVECLVTNSTEEPEPTIRLINGPVPHAGNVEFLYNGNWHGVCKVAAVAKIICRQLGYQDVLATTSCCRVFDRNHRGYWLFSFHGCRGGESKLLQCPHRRKPRGQYCHFRTGVVCKPNSSLSQAKNFDE